MYIFTVVSPLPNLVQLGRTFGLSLLEEKQINTYTRTVSCTSPLICGLMSAARRIDVVVAINTSSAPDRLEERRSMPQFYARHTSKQ